MTTAPSHSTIQAGNEATEREKFYADLNRTRAETDKMYAEMRRLNLESSRSMDETMKMRAERDKAEAEAKKIAMDTMKTQLEIRWYTPVVSGAIAVAWFSAGAAFVTGLMKLLSVWGK
jgi:SMC interacting uncharacterized protein involved in chromosome segregation